MRAPALALVKILILALAHMILAHDAVAEPVNPLRLGAATGDIPSEMALADAYVQGAGVPQSDANAVGWWARAAAQGHAPAYLLVAQAYHDGRGVAKDLDTAMRWFEKSAATGNTTALNELAWHTMERGGDLDRALTLVNQALAAQPENSHYLDTKACILQKLHHRHHEAYALLKKAHTLSPQDQDVQAHLSYSERHH